MATLCLHPPTPFNFRKPEEWKKCKSCFEKYHRHEKNQPIKQQVSSLLYCMGEDAEVMLISYYVISNRDKADYNKVLGKFDGYFKV